MATLYTVGHGAPTLGAAGIAYDWQGKPLGGRRPQGFEAHMASDEFKRAAAALATAEERLCIMCAEGDPRQCHRSLVADWLVARGHRVIHLLDENTRREQLL